MENLWCNFLGRPDFIAYKLTDLPKLTVTLLRIFSGTTIAVWTLRTKDAIHEGKQEYDIQIFELSSEKNLKELPAESPSIFRISQ